MKTIEKRVIVTKTNEGVFFYTLQIRKWFNFPLLRTMWKTISPESQPTYEDAINLICKPNSLEQTEAGGQFLKTSQAKENQQSTEQLLLKHDVIKSVCEKHQWHFFRVEKIRQCQVCGKMENY